MQKFFSLDSLDNMRATSAALLKSDDKGNQSDGRILEKVMIPFMGFMQDEMVLREGKPGEIVDLLHAVEQIASSIMLSAAQSICRDDSIPDVLAEMHMGVGRRLIAYCKQAEAMTRPEGRA